MRNLTTILCASAMVLCGCHRAARQAIPADAAMEKAIEKQLSKMTLEQKVGQMCELTIDCITDWNAPDFQLSDSAVESVFGTYYVGSILNVPRSAAQKPATWVNLIRTINDRSEQTSGIAQLYGVDQNHGSTYTYGGTMLPQPINQAASFDRTIPYRGAQITAYESRACLIPWVYNPTMDLMRNPMWPRCYESFGEDVLVNAEMAVATVRGYQGEDPNHLGRNNVAACIKHYMGYGNPVNGKDRTPSMITDRELREKYFEPFRRCAQAGALSLMVSSAPNNGLPMHANRKLIQGWLKDELGWDGMVVSDWADMMNIYKRDHVTETYKDAICLSVNAGVDMAMEPYTAEFCTLLLEGVREGKVSEERIDDACRRILRLKYRLGLQDRTTWDLTAEQAAEQYPDFAQFDDEVVRIAEQTMVLLRNENNILPLRKGTRILVTGPNANSFRPMNGGWSYSWQGDITDRCAREIGTYRTFYEAIRDEFGAANVTLCEGVRYAVPGEMDPQLGWDAKEDNITWESEYRPDIQSAVRAAAGVDVIIACIGENSYTETPGNMTNLDLSANQQALVRALQATGKPVILVLNEGRPRLITDLVPRSAAIIDAMIPGNYGGIALANLIAGKANFSAKLPFTYPMHPASIEVYDYKPCENQGVMAGNYNYDAKMDVLYPFGSGMSYTNFAYSNLTVDRTDFRLGDVLTFRVTVTNTGSVAGAEPVLLYVSDLVASLTPDVRRLRAFEKVNLKPGESIVVSLTVDAADLGFVGLDEQWILEQGEFVATCGGQVLKLNCTTTSTYTK